MTKLRLVLTFLALALAPLFLSATAPQAATVIADEDLTRLVNALGAGGFAETEAAVTALAASGDDRVAGILDKLGSGDLVVRKEDKAVFLAEKAGADVKLTSLVDGKDAGVVAKGAVDKLKVNNKLRRTIASAVGALTLRSPDPAVRRSAAEAVMKSKDAAAVPPRCRHRRRAGCGRQGGHGLGPRLRRARLGHARGRQARRGRHHRRARHARRARPPLRLHRRRRPVGEAARLAAAGIENKLALWDAGQNVWYGLSLGSVLLLAAIGLAVTFGVMGVINMAHGEMVMLGAYTTFVVQEAIRTYAPGLFDLSLFIALPLAFLVAGAVGILIERTVIRWLYGRPLETLLATGASR